MVPGRLYTMSKPRKDFYTPKIREIAIVGLQVKSIEKARLLAEALDVIEVECGVGSIQIRFTDMFVCPDIQWDSFETTPMERLVRRCLSQ